jgi:hypothetical protein
MTEVRRVPSITIDGDSGWVESGAGEARMLRLCSATCTRRCACSGMQSSRARAAS